MRSQTREVRIWEPGFPKHGARARARPALSGTAERTRSAVGLYGLVSHAIRLLQPGRRRRSRKAVPTAAASTLPAIAKDKLSWQPSVALDDGLERTVHFFRGLLAQ